MRMYIYTLNVIIISLFILFYKVFLSLERLIKNYSQFALSNIFLKINQIHVLKKNCATFCYLHFVYLLCHLNLACNVQHMWKLVVERVLELNNQVSGMYPFHCTGCYVSVCCFSLFSLMCRNFLFLRIFFILAWWRKTIQSKQIWGLLCQKAHRKVRVGFEKKITLLSSSGRHT